MTKAQAPKQTDIEEAIAAKTEPAAVSADTAAAEDAAIEGNGKETLDQQAAAPAAESAGDTSPANSVSSDAGNAEKVSTPASVTTTTPAASPKASGDPVDYETFCQNESQKTWRIGKYCTQSGAVLHEERITGDNKSIVDKAHAMACEKVDENFHKDLVVVLHSDNEFSVTLNQGDKSFLVIDAGVV